MKGVMKEGNEIQFISSVNGYGVTSLIEKLNPNEFVQFRHSADTKEVGEQEREKEWTGGMESYSLVEKDGVTTLIVEIDVPLGQEETFKDRQPKALELIKELAEKGKQKESGIYLTLGMSLGAGLGVTIGAVIGSISGEVGKGVALGIAFGSGIGVTIGAILSALSDNFKK